MAAQWPATTISQETFTAALQVIGESQAVIGKFAPASGAGVAPTDKRQILEAFIGAAATPEQRQELAKEIGYSYEDLTNLVIRADLQRLDDISPGLAMLMVVAGVKGVYDLAACVEDPQRLGKLESDLEHSLTQTQLQALGAKCRKLESKVVADVSVIIVVKGGGQQKPDETLDVFVNGFWPAVKSIDANATISKRRDIFPSDYRSSAYDKEPLNHVTEIGSGERRIWIKEPNWEAALVPDSPLNALSKEWRMATYTFASGIHDMLSRYKLSAEEYVGNTWDYYKAFFIIYWLLFWHVGLTGLWGRKNWTLGGGFSVVDALKVFGLIAAVVTVAAALAAILPAIKTDSLTKRSRITKQLESLPGVSILMLGLLILAFVYSPGGYLLWLLVVVILELALLRARSIAWPYRELSNTDSTTDNYFSVNSKIRKLTTDWRRRIFVLLYRYIVVLTLPITFLGLTAARFLKWTRLLGGIGEGLEKTLNTLLSGFLGDVVTYAMNPAQAHRVRSVVQSDLVFFHRKPEVSHIHVFAHSQGTPITFETLFHHLLDDCRGKIKTYVTIGSVLSYYNQANPILDPIFVRRFPVIPYPKFGEGFKWLNFWNLIDPITEFYGLDEYNLVKEAPALEFDNRGHPKPISPERFRDETKRYPASPTNIKTRATLENHSEYWHNRDQVQVPLALRVLGVERPQQWNPETLKTFKPGLQHTTYVWRLWIVFSAIFLLAFAADVYLALWVVTRNLSLTQELASLLPLALKSMSASQSGLLQTALSALTWLVEAAALNYSREILGILVLLAAPLSIALLLSLIAYIVSTIRGKS